MLVLGGVSNVPGLMLRMWACGKMFNFNWRPTSRMSNWFVDEELDMGNSEICWKKRRCPGQRLCGVLVDSHFCYQQ